MIPVTLVTGFLGAGKSSLIAHLLDESPDRRIAVIVNDIGSESIDRAYLAGGEHLPFAPDPLIQAISGGRIGADKGRALDAAIADAARLDPPPEMIVVEGSGGSPVYALIERLRALPETSPVRLERVIAVVDTATYRASWGNDRLRDLVADQLALADLVVCTRADRVGPLTRFRVRRHVARVAALAEVIEAPFGRIPPELLFDSGAHGEQPPRPRTRGPRVHAANATFQPFVARQLTDRRPFHPTRLEQWLNSEWEGILRVKGFIWLAHDMEHVYAIDAAGAQRELGLEGTWWAAVSDPPTDPLLTDELTRHQWGDRRQNLTVIGTADDVERQMARLRGALLSGSEQDEGPLGWARMPNPFDGRFEDAEDPGTT